MILIPRRIHKIVIVTSILLLLLIYGVYWLFFQYLVGLASAFSNG